MLRPIHDPKRGRMRVVGLVSGSGKSLRTTIDLQVQMESAGRAPYKVVGIFTDNPVSKAAELGRGFNIPVIENDIKAFYEERGKKITNRKVREEYDRLTAEALEPLRPHILAYAGYVWITTEPLVGRYQGVNVHPADLSIERYGRRAYAGAQGVRDALLAGERELRSTAHLTTPIVDGGPILMISEPVRVDGTSGKTLEELSREYLRLLNEKNRLLLPRVIKDIAEGTFKLDDSGLLYYGETPIPKGYRL